MAARSPLETIRNGRVFVGIFGQPTSNNTGWCCADAVSRTAGAALGDAGWATVAGLELDANSSAKEVKSHNKATTKTQRLRRAKRRL